MEDAKRRLLLKTAAIQGAALGLTGAGLWLPGSAAAQTVNLKWGNLSPGFTVIVSDYMEKKGIDKKHGINLGKPVSYANVATYYNDFVAGNYDVCIGSWDTFASRYLAGVPVQLVCSITTGNMINVVVPGNGATSIKGLEGKTLAVPQSTGVYRMMRAIMKEMAGIDIETAMKVQNVDNPAAAVTLVMADRADAGMTWEPNISVGLSKKPDMRILYNAGEEYKKKVGLDLPYFGIAVRKSVLERDPTIGQRLNKAFAECLAGVMSNVDEALAISGGGTGISAEVLKTAITSGRLQFKYVSMADDKGRQTVKTAAEFLVRNGLLPRSLDDGFFVL
jgi:NitT/TauT family transport system substrate-binding protein